MANESSEYDALTRHLGHDVEIRVPGYDAPVFVWCLGCDEGVLAYGDPEQMAFDEFLEEEANKDV